MAMGYSGFAQFVDGGGTKVTLLTTSSSINTNPNPILSQAALGYGWANAPDASHYAEGVLVYQGGIGFDMQAINGVWGFLRDFAIYDRAQPKTLWYSPDGTRIFKYTAPASPLTDASLPSAFTGAWCESFGLSTSADQLVTSNMNVIALIRSEVDLSTGYFGNEAGYLEGANITQFENTQPLNPLSGGEPLNTSPVPFWKTTASLKVNDVEVAGPTTSTQVMAWNTNLANNTQVVKTCSGERKAMCVVVGPMAVDGSVTLYSPGGVWDPILTHKIVADNSNFSVDILGASTYTVALPAIMLQGDDYSLNVGAPVSRTFNLKGLGGKVGGDFTAGTTARIPPMYMSAV